MHATETPTPTCSIVVRADGATCGAPAVVTFTTRRGETFAECVDHAVAPSAPEPIKVGDRVVVDHVGVSKTGTVVKVTSTKAHVEVSTYGGASSKVVVRPIAEVAR